MANLVDKRCQSCGKTVKVSMYAPNDDKEISGIHLYSMDEYFTEHHLGVLCKECAFSLCDMGELTLGFAGGRLNDMSLWDAVLEPQSNKSKGMQKDV